ncbi:MAG TPA: hypothetical protein VJ813_20530 [Vicinamibacterales bacterium]|nr:hypothetical protein [Vicinamibacterales bacterium]
MRRLISFALATMPATLLAIQTPADFSGRWTAIEPQKIAGHELVVMQDAGTLRLEQMRLRSGETYDEFGRPRGPQKGERESTMYRLDGEVLVTKRGDQSIRSSLRRDNGRILLRDQYQPPGVTFERSLSFDNRGRLVLEHRRPAPADDPSQASETVLDIRRIVFERR